MNDYTPTTEHVRTAYGAAVTFPTMSLPERRRAFNRWLDQVRAEAWSLGVGVGMFYGPLDIPPNPYRQETDT